MTFRGSGGLLLLSGDPRGMMELVWDFQIVWERKQRPSHENAGRTTWGPCRMNPCHPTRKAHHQRGVS